MRQNLKCSKLACNVENPALQNPRIQANIETEKIEMPMD